MKILARSVSYLLHPFLIPLYGLFFIFNTGSVFSIIPGRVQIYCYAVTVLSLVLIPVFGMFLMKKFNLITDYDLEMKQERIYPALLTIFSAFLGFYLIGRIPYAVIIQQLFLILIIVLSGFSIITLRWKISMHMTAIGAICGFLMIIGLKYMGDVRLVFMLMLILSGILAASRLYLKKHNPAQIYTGFLLGITFVVGILF